VQDKIALDAEDEKTLALTREATNGLERVVWNPALSIPAREFELVDAEVARLKAALATWDSYAAGANPLSTLCSRWPLQSGRLGKWRHLRATRLRHIFLRIGGQEVGRGELRTLIGVRNLGLAKAEGLKPSRK
jgi:hypothetical protein